MRADAEYLAQGGTTIWVECSEDPRSFAIAELLLSWGLDLYYFAFPAHNPDNQRGDPVPIFPLAYEAGLLAAPRVPPTLDNTLRAHRCILRQVHSIDELKDAMWRTPRWGMLEWLGAGPEEVAALAGRALRGETFDDYLTPSWSPAGAPVEVLGRRINAAEKSIEIERERADTAEAALARTTLCCWIGAPNLKPNVSAPTLPKQRWPGPTLCRWIGFPNLEPNVSAPTLPRQRWPGPTLCRWIGSLPELSRTRARRHCREQGCPDQRSVAG